MIVRLSIALLTLLQSRIGEVMQPHAEAATEVEIYLETSV